MNTQSEADADRDKAAKLLRCTTLRFDPLALTVDRVAAALAAERERAVSGVLALAEELKAEAADVSGWAEVRAADRIRAVVAAAHTEEGR